MSLRGFHTHRVSFSWLALALAACTSRAPVPRAGASESSSASRALAASAATTATGAPGGAPSGVAAGAATQPSSEPVAADSSSAPPTDAHAESARAALESARRTATNTPRLTADMPVIRGLYVNRFAAESPKKMARLVALADTTEINAFVIDIKDEFGINYATKDAVVRPNAGRGGVIENLPALLDTLKAHGIIPIARIVVFKDSVTARVHPEWTIRAPDSTIWRDKQGLAWVNPYHEELWDYNIRVAEEVARMGFEEIQFDYIRFPEPYKTLPTQVFQGSDGRAKSRALAEFLAMARGRLNELGVRVTADVFGLVTTATGAIEVGQAWEPLAREADALLPMVYPSHYPAGSFGVKKPNAEPYQIVFSAIKRARERDEKLGIAGEHVRAWLQAFTLGSPAYGPTQLREQIRAVYDAGYDSWILWNPGSQYDVFTSAFEPTLVSHKSAYPIH
jgi:hypothetical protein